MQIQENKDQSSLSRRRFFRRSSLALLPMPYEQEHWDLITSIREGHPLNEAQTVAESTLTAILGREATYSGKAVEWDVAMKSTARLGPEKCEFGPYPMPEVAMPGRYRLL